MFRLLRVIIYCFLLFSLAFSQKMKNGLWLQMNEYNHLSTYRSSNTLIKGLLDSLCCRISGRMTNDTITVISNKIHQNWDTTKNDWFNNFKDIFDYNSKGNRTEYLRLNWSDNNWVNSAKMVSTFDTNGNTIEYKWLAWSDSSWVNDASGICSYNKEGRITNLIYQNWNDSVWENFFLAFYSYDSNGNEIESLGKIWNESLWVNSYKIVSTYDSHRNMAEYIRQEWKNNAWENYNKGIFAYDSNNNMVEYLWLAWYDTSWVNTTKDIYSYDESGNSTGYIAYIWSNNTWNYLIYATSTYNEQGMLDEELVQFWINNSWVKQYRILYTYQQLITDVVDEPSTPTTITLHQNYPNPFNPVTVINYQLQTKSDVVLKIYDVLGREVVTLVDETQSAGNNSVRWDASNMPSGVYYYRLQTGQYSEMKKLVLAK